MLRNVKRSLKGRIEHILLASALELDGNSYVNNYELNDLKSIKDFILYNLRGKMKNIDTNTEITISKKSAKKLASHYKDGEAYQKTIVHIPKIIENMKFLEEMQPHKENAHFDKYSYYITEVNIDGKPYTILSTVGCVEQNVYYDQNVFNGTSLEVFQRAKQITDDPKYSRLNDILKRAEEDGWNPIGLARPQTPTTL